MTTSLLTTIALLCLNPNGSDSAVSVYNRDTERLGCQRYYVKCVKKKQKRIFKYTHLDECILEKKN